MISVELEGNHGNVEHLETLVLSDEDRERFDKIKELSQTNEQLQESIRLVKCFDILRYI